MKNQILSIIIIGLLLSTILGLATMNHMEEGSMGCPFASPGMVSCTQSGGVFDYVVSHLNAFSQFSSGIPLDSLAISVALFAALVLSTFVFYNLELLKHRFISIRNRSRGSYIPTDTLLMIAWLSLHENSPAIIIER